MLNLFKNFFIIIIVFFLFLQTSVSEASNTINYKLSGRILLEVESNGEAWYINPENKLRYYLGRPLDAFNLLRNLGVGISNKDLNKIPIGLIDTEEADSDGDGLPDSLEIAIGTSPLLKDTDGDGFDDKTEIINGYNPLGPGKMNFDNEFTEKHLGKIFLQVERNGEAWYVDPVSKKRYFLSRPEIAFEIMRKFGLGISQENIDLIKKYEKEINLPIETEPILDESTNIINLVADAIRKKDAKKASSYFIETEKRRVEYAVNNMSNESLLILGNILSGSKIAKKDNYEIIYKNEVYFDLGGQYINLEFKVRKQEDGTWLMMNL